MSITITVDGVDIMTVTDNQLTLLAYNYPKVAIKQGLINRIKNIVNMTLRDTKNDMQNDWLDIIKQRYNSMPTKDNELLSLVISQPDYKDYDTRNAT